jgi:hypothetical protein
MSIKSMHVSKKRESQQYFNDVILTRVQMNYNQNNSDFINLKS